MRVWNLDKPVQKCSGLSKTTPGLAFEEVADSGAAEYLCFSGPLAALTMHIDSCEMSL